MKRKEALMMSLNNANTEIENESSTNYSEFKVSQVNTFDATKKLFRFKLLAYSGTFVSLIGIQILGLLFSLGGVSMAGTGGNNMMLSVHNFSANIIIVFTIMWGFVIAMTLTTKPYRLADFVFVTNRITSHLSNIIFIVFASIIGGITAMLSGYVLKVGIFFWYGAESVVFQPISFTELVVGIITTIAYVALFSAIGYFVGMLVQLNKAFGVVIPVMFIGTLITAGRRGEESVIYSIFRYYVNDASLWVFVITVFVLCYALFYGATILTNRMEVRQ